MFTVYSFNRFQVKKKQFFRNFMTINLFGVIGTLISFAIISFGMFICFQIKHLFVFLETVYCGLTCNLVLNLGATLLFPKLDIGYLEIKDYLGIYSIFLIFNFFFLWINCLCITNCYLFEIHFFCLIVRSTWSHIFRNRFCLHLAGTWS